MKKIVFVIVVIFLFLGIVAICKKQVKPEFMPCPALSGDETRQVTLPKSLYYGESANSVVEYMKKQGRCVDGYVNTAKEPVVIFDQKTLEGEYQYYLNELQKDLDYDLPHLKEEVSYDFSSFTIYVDDETKFKSFRTSMMVIPGTCIMLRLLRGELIKQIHIDVIVVYEPSGKEILRLDETSQMTISEEDWNELLESGKR